MKPNESYFTTQQVADIFNVTGAAVLKWVKAGTMQSMQVGNGRGSRLYFTIGSVQAHLDNLLSSVPTNLLQETINKRIAK